MAYKNLLPLYLIGFYPIALTLGTLISESFTVILSLLFLYECIKNKKIFFVKDKIIYFLLIIWLYLLFNLFISIDFKLSFNRSIFFIRHILLILSIAYFFTKYPKEVEIVFKIWMITILITILDLYVQFFFGQNILGFKSPWDSRLSGFFNQELKVAHLLIGFFLPSFAFYLGKNKKNVYLFISFVLYFSILLLTNERANIIRGTLAIFIFLIFLPYFKTKIKIIFCSSLVIIFCLILFYAKPVKDRFLQEISNMDVNNSLANYVILSNYGPHYLTSFEIFKKNMLFGTGIKTFRVSCKNVSIEKYYENNDVLPRMGCGTHPHQYYFELFSDLGLIGFIIFVLFFIYIIFRIINGFLLSKNLVLLSTSVFFITQLIPFLPTGSFFTSFGSTIFFINLGLIFNYIKKKN